ncbi:energy-coupling factor transporter transmembrane protein EcfT [Aeromicrobium sp. 50.2.37]|uniref:energy-coupling factor transporter transmembrane component T family protein n=1 Tax=Aeromicrobium sp. 50.2.37 TaxID=2969305 RepID=UPI0021504FD4|nr:energy-coupling factor transporter transmembrane protein EcfT [Aeromicrobium sp. 50.2.37]MCR4514180.1 energy-coupling factor transporter transmembrane protein EcfT [Aeromicrobium sp. 50.2.37]
MTAPARDLHPGAWWLWALGLAAAASFTLNPLVLALIAAVVVLVVMARRSEAPWAMSFRFYMYFALFVVVLRVVYRILFGGGALEGDTIVLHLPEIPLPDAARGIQLLGDVTSTALLGALYDGMRLAVIILCVGAANSLANPRRLLAAVPPAFYEVGTAVVVALSVFPQLAESVQRVNRARRLRGDAGKGVGRLRRVVVPVLEDALERSMTLAAGMDARGYGRSGTATSRERLVTGVLMLTGLGALCVGAYAYLDGTAPRLLAGPVLVLGVLLAAAALWLAGRRVQRTRYRPDRWRRPEVLTALCGVVVAVGVDRAFDLDPYVVVPDLERWPTIGVPLVLVLLVGVLPAFLAPPPAPDVAGGADRAGGSGRDAEEVDRARAA